MPSPTRAAATLSALAAVLITALAPLTGCGSDGASGRGTGIVVRDATLDVPANPDLGAVRLVLENTGEVDDALVGASTLDADSAMVHRSGTDPEGRATMDAVGQVEVPAGGTVVFEAGGLHVMLSGLHRDLAVGDTVSLDLLFAEAGTVTVEVEVVEPGSADVSDVSDATTDVSDVSDATTDVSDVSDATTDDAEAAAAEAAAAGHLGAGSPAEDARAA